MALVYRGICREEVIIFFAFHIPNLHAFTTCEDNFQGVVVVGTVLVFQFDGLFLSSLRVQSA